MQSAQLEPMYTVIAKGADDAITPSELARNLCYPSQNIWTSSSTFPNPSRIAWRYEQALCSDNAVQQTCMLPYEITDVSFFIAFCALSKAAIIGPFISGSI